MPLTLIALSLALSAPIPKDLKPTDTQLVLGTWKRTVYKFGNAAGPIISNTDYFWKIEAKGKGRRLADDTNTEFEYKLDPSAKLKTFEYTWSGNTFVGIYELSKDKLKVAMVQTGLPRPTKLEPAEGAYYFEMTRVANK